MHALKSGGIWLRVLALLEEIPRIPSTEMRSNRRRLVEVSRSVRTVLPAAASAKTN